MPSKCHQYNHHSFYNNSKLQAYSPTHRKQTNKQNKSPQTNNNKNPTQNSNKKAQHCQLWRVGNSLCLHWTVALWQRCCSRLSATAPSFTISTPSWCTHTLLPQHRPRELTKFINSTQTIYRQYNQSTNFNVFPFFREAFKYCISTIYLKKSTLQTLQKMLRCTFPLIFNLNGRDISICLLLLTKC